jgi:hypothetical protein
MTPSTRAALGDDQWRAALFGDGIDRGAHIGGKLAALGSDMGGDGVAGALANRARRPAVDGRKVDAAHARLRREGHEGRRRLGKVAPTQPKALFRQHDNRAAFRRFVGQRRQLRGVGQGRRFDAGAG